VGVSVAVGEGLGVMVWVAVKVTVWVGGAAGGFVFRQLERKRRRIRLAKKFFREVISFLYHQLWKNKSRNRTEKTIFVLLFVAPAAVLGVRSVFYYI
jgi:hypothetical protein